MTAFWSRKKGGSAPEFDLRFLLELTPDGVLGVSADGEVKVVNEKAAELFGYPASEMVGSGVESFLPNIFGTRLLPHRRCPCCSVS